MLRALKSSFLCEKETKEKSCCVFISAVKLRKRTTILVLCAHLVIRVITIFDFQTCPAVERRGSWSIPPTRRSISTSRPRWTASRKGSRSPTSDGTGTDVPWTRPVACAKPFCRTGRYCFWRRRRANGIPTRARIGVSPRTRSAKP